MTSRELLLLAVARGYRIDEHGQAFGPKGRLSPRTTGDDYQAICMRVDGKVKNVAVHRLAAYQLFGERVFEDGVEVRHLDSNHSNNAATNLALGTPSENSLDRPPHVRQKMAEHAAQKRRRLTDAELAALRQDRAQGMEYRDLAKKYKVSVGAAHYMVSKGALKPLLLEDLTNGQEIA